MDIKQNKDTIKKDELDRICKNLLYAVKFTFGEMESQALARSIQQIQERSA